MTKIDELMAIFDTVLSFREGTNSHDRAVSRFRKALEAALKPGESDKVAVLQAIVDSNTGFDAREIQHRHTMDQFKEVCKGSNCHASKAMPHHSDECKAEHDKATVYTAAPPAQTPSHSDDAAVDAFAAAMKAKLAASREKGRGGWDNKSVCTQEALQRMLVEHLAKGDPVDVGNFAMMLFNRCERTATPAQTPGARSAWPPHTQT